MTRTLKIWASLTALPALGLACCATPAYPTHASPAPTSPPPAAPTAPTPAPEPVPAPSAPPSTGPQGGSPPSGAPAIESQQLPPIGAPTAQPPPSPAQSALPPGYSPPPAEASPPESSTSPIGPPPSVRYHSTPERVVAGGKVVAARGMYRDYTVQPKDHVDAIARDLQTTRKILVEANHLKAPYALQPGQHLKVPVEKAYEVQSGDTMADVAKRFGVSVGDLSDLNNLSAHARLHAGDMLALPADFHDHGPIRIPGAMVAERTYEPVEAAPPPRSSPPALQATGGPYVPSPAALAAARRLAATRPSEPSASPPVRPSAAPPVSTAPETPSEPPTAAQLAIASAGRGRFIWPARGEIISPFGVKGVGRRNDGIDVRAAQGTPVRAAAAGDVVYAGDQVPGFGNLILIKHADGWVTAYAHLQSIDVTMRQSVVQGQALGEVGSTGGVSEPQLHFEIRYAPTPSERARPVDPLLVLPK